MFPTDLTNIDGLDTDRVGTGSLTFVASDSNAQGTAIQQLAAKVGTDGSAVATSLDYRVGQLEAGGGGITSVNGDTGPVVVLNQDEVGDGTTYKRFSQAEKARLAGPSGSLLGDTDAQSVSNKTLDNTNSATFVDTAFVLQDNGNNTRQATFDVGLVSALATRNISIPNASGTMVLANNSQTLTNKSIGASQIDSGTLPDARMPALTGDVTTSAGAVATTLSTVNSNVGSFVAANVTVNAKGLVTAAASTVNQVSTASSATPAPTGDSWRNELYVTALAANATVAAPSGTAANGNSLLIRIKDNGTSRTLAFNAIFRAVGVTLPTATVVSKTLYLGCRYNSADTKWDVLAVGSEA